MREANLEKVEITSASPAAGKLIHELQLRTQTGASIVGIERGEHNLALVNILKIVRALDIQPSEFFKDLDKPAKKGKSA